MAEWPQTISPQVLRSRLAAYKRELCDFNFNQVPCGSCCRLKRRCKLKVCTFSSISSETCPSWLPWSVEEWQLHRKSWWNSIDDLFNIDHYLERFFHTTGRLCLAQQELLGFEEGSGFTSSFPSKLVAEAWVRRVELWICNLRSDLIKDSVDAPGSGGAKRWLLVPSSESDLPSSTSEEITTLLCKRCRESLSGVTKNNKPAVKMPDVARANGMWRGPDPEELIALSYAECKVINLARIYVSVKRVFLDRTSYAQTSAAEAPLYHQKNVVAYPQSVDSAVSLLGVNPKDLASMLTVQFVGENRADLCHHPDLSVSVERLRAALTWLSFNSWPYMEATQHHAVWESNRLPEALEVLLAQYASSVRCVTGGTPCELVQGASRITAERASVFSAGPVHLGVLSERLT